MEVMPEMHSVREALNGSKPSDILLKPENSEQAKENWRVLLSIWHPDKNKGFDIYANEVTKAINLAYDFFKNGKSEQQLDVKILDVQAPITSIHLKENQNKVSEVSKRKKETQASQVLPEQLSPIPNDPEFKLISAEGEPFIVNMTAARQLLPVDEAIKNNAQKREYQFEQLSTKQLAIIIKILDVWYRFYRNDKPNEGVIYNIIKDQLDGLTLSEKSQLFDFARFIHYTTLEEIVRRNLKRYFVAKLLEIPNDWRKVSGFLSPLIRDGLKWGILSKDDKKKVLDINLNNADVSDNDFEGILNFLEFLRFPQEFNAPNVYSGFTVNLNLANNRIHKVNVPVGKKRIFWNIKNINLKGNPLAEEEKNMVRKLFEACGVDL